MMELVVESDIAEIGRRIAEPAKELAGKTVMITGARGFLGRYFTEVILYLNQHVLDRPCKLVAVDNLITAGASGSQIVEYPNVTFVKHDVIKPFAWDETVHYVIHAAGIASPFYYRAFPLETLEVAISGTRNMLELASRDRAKFTFFSSSEIYGDPDPVHVPTPESYRGNVSSQGPRACYDESKRVGETLCYIFHENHGVATNVIRPFNVYGPGMQETDYRVLPNFASRIKSNKPLNIYGSGNQTRTFCYITDAMVGFMLVALRGVPGETYNIGNPTPEVSMVDLVTTIEKVLKRPVAHNRIEYPDSYPADEPNRRCPDIRKAKLQLGYSAEVDLKEGLRRFLAWTDRTFSGEP